MFLGLFFVCDGVGDLGGVLVGFCGDDVGWGCRGDCHVELAGRLVSFSQLGQRRGQPRLFGSAI